MHKSRKSYFLPLTQAQQATIETLQKLYRIVISQVGDSLERTASEFTLNLEASLAAFFQAPKKERKKIFGKKDKKAASTKTENEISIKDILEGLKRFYINLSSVDANHFEQMIENHQALKAVIGRVYVQLAGAWSNVKAPPEVMPMSFKEADDFRKKFDQELAAVKEPKEKAAIRDRYREQLALCRQVEESELESLASSQLYGCLSTYFLRVHFLLNEEGFDQEPPLLMFGRFWLEILDAVTKNNRIFIDVKKVLQVINDFQFLFEDALQSVVFRQDVGYPLKEIKSEKVTEIFQKSFQMFCYCLGLEKVRLLAEALGSKQLSILLFVSELVVQLGMETEEHKFIIASRELNKDVVMPYVSAMTEILNALCTAIQGVYSELFGKPYERVILPPQYKMFLTTFEKQPIQQARWNSLLQEITSQYPEITSQFFSSITYSQRRQGQSKEQRQKRLKESKQLRNSLGAKEGKILQEQVNTFLGKPGETFSRTSVKDVFGDDGSEGAEKQHKRAQSDGDVLPEHSLLQKTQMAQTGVLVSDAEKETPRSSKFSVGNQDLRMSTPLASIGENGDSISPRPPSPPETNQRGMPRGSSFSGGMFGRSLSNLSDASEEEESPSPFPRGMSLMDLAAASKGESVLPPRQVRAKPRRDGKSRITILSSQSSRRFSTSDIYISSRLPAETRPSRLSGERNGSFSIDETARGRGRRVTGRPSFTAD